MGIRKRIEQKGKITALKNADDIGIGERAIIFSLYKFYVIKRVWRACPLNLVNIFTFFKIFFNIIIKY